MRPGHHARSSHASRSEPQSGGCGCVVAAREPDGRIVVEPAQDRSLGPSDSQVHRLTAQFNLELEDYDGFRDELRTWRSIGASRDSPSSSAMPASPAPSTVPPMVLDVLLDTRDIPSNRVLALSSRRVESASLIVLERWTLSLLPTPPDALDSAPALPTVYKQSIILVRALHALCRTLPTWDLHAQLKRRGSGGAAGLRLGCRMSAGEEAAGSAGELGLQQHLLGPGDRDADASATVETFRFAPVQTSLGFLHLQVSYRPHADFTVEGMETVLSNRFLDEDYFQPGRRGPAPSSLPTQPGVVGPPAAAASTVGPYGSMPMRQPSLPIPQRDRLSPASITDFSPRRASPTVPAMQRVASTGGSSYAGASSHDGAFASLGRVSGSRIASGQASALASPSLPPVVTRRPSIGTVHPFKPTTATAPRDIGAPSGIAVAGPSSASPGPSSYLRYSASPSSAPYYDASPFPTGSVSSSSPRSFGSRPAPMQMRRYSSNREKQASLGGDTFGSSSSSPPIWGPESLGRRTRLLSTSSGGGGLESIAAASASRRGPSPVDKEDIAAFLDSLSIATPLSSNEARLVSRREADERLRALAGSVYGETGPPPAASLIGLGQSPLVPSAARQRPLSRPTSFTASSPILDDDEAVGRLELSQDDDDRTTIAQRPTLSSGSGSPSSTRQHSREQSTDRGETAYGLLGRGRARPGRALAMRSDSNDESG